MLIKNISLTSIIGLLSCVSEIDSSMTDEKENACVIYSGEIVLFVLFDCINNLFMYDDLISFHGAFS